MIKILLLSCVPCQTTQDLPPDPSFRGLGNILMGHANISRVSASATSFARLLPCWTFPLPHISNFYLRCWISENNNRLDSSFIFMQLLDRMIAIVAHRCYLGDFISVRIFIILSLSKLALHDPDRHWPTLHHPHHLQKYHFLLLILHETVFIFILFCNIWKRAPLLWFDPLTFPLTSATILAPFTPKLKTAMTDYKIDSQCFCTKTGNE